MSPVKSPVPMRGFAAAGKFAENFTILVDFQ